MKTNRPEPVLAPVVRTSVVASVTTGIALAVAFGWDVTPEQREAILGATTALLGLAGSAYSVWQALQSRKETTPIISPYDEQGNPLFPDAGGIF